MQRSDMHKAVSEMQRARHEIQGAMQSSMQDSMEFSAEVTRAGLSAAIKMGHQTIGAAGQFLSAATDNAMAGAKATASVLPRAGQAARRAA